MKFDALSNRAGYSEFSQYALLLSYFQYCQHMLDPDVPATVLQGLLVNEEDSEDVDLQKVSTSILFFQVPEL